jgi:NAD(P)-dependent dehydrogenase (short-subunit alcohol dehydrogenase family)
MKKIFLTGASSGIGRATAEALLARGHEVWGTSRDQRRIPAAERLHPVQLDLANRESIRSGFGRALDEAGAFDVVINNAGSGHFGPAELLADTEIAQLFQSLVFAHIEVCRLALEAMRVHQRGTILNVTSLAAELPVPFMAGYNAAKAAMASFTMTMQLELGSSPVRLIDLQPGDICTGFNDAISKSGMDQPEYAQRVERSWRVVDQNMRNAPKPELVGRRIAELIEMDNPPPRVIVGDAFQAKVAPVIFRLLPQRLRLWGLRQYYGI